MKVFPDKGKNRWLLLLLAGVLLLMIYRIGFHRPVPGFDEEKIEAIRNTQVE